MSVTAAQGFTAGSTAAGLKPTGQSDVAVVINHGPMFSAGAVFTRNRVKAAPVLLSEESLATAHRTGTPITTVALNSGGANTCTGAQGMRDAASMAAAAGAAVGAGYEQALVCSTGLIGTLLPMDALTAGIAAAAENAGDSAEHGTGAAQAIMTTDSVHKEAQVSRGGITVGGMAKGAGMLAPQLATMLVVITTDADITHKQAQKAVADAVTTTFNRVDSDACMSTNDSVILLASGASGVKPSQKDITQMVREVSADLARQLVADAEGASHDVHVTVTSATTEDAAEAVAREICRSNLVKAAIFGNDPNWGRIVAAAGCVPEQVAPFSADDLSVTVNGIEVCRGGGVGRDRDLVDMTPREVEIVVDLGAGTASADMWTNDLTHDYVEENSAYST